MPKNLPVSDPASGLPQPRAVVIGINSYNDPIPTLHNAVRDAERLAAILCQKHNYRVQLYTEEAATLGALQTILENLSNKKHRDGIHEEDRLLFYFAGHGVKFRSNDGPTLTGFLLPHGATEEEPDKYLAMDILRDTLDALPCHHLLLILDCCFAGAAAPTMRDWAQAPPLIKPRFDLYLTHQARHLLASTSANKKALDQTGERAEGQHSPFAQALIDALDSDAADRSQPPDGVITATDLYSYVREQVAQHSGAHFHTQIPLLDSLKHHGLGEYIFFVPNKPLTLPPTEKLSPVLNPYRGLRPYEEGDQSFFMGRVAVVDELTARVAQQPLVVALGPSGCGKSSLVQAGLLPRLRDNGWTILDTIRPGVSPLVTLSNVLAEYSAPTLAERIAQFMAEQPGSIAVLVIDQFEELVRLSEKATRTLFLDQLDSALAQHSDSFHLVVTLRSDFEPQLAAWAPLAGATAAKVRFLVRPMNREELRQVIVEPGAPQGLVFESAALVNSIIDEVVQSPGALPLLSFALEQIYLQVCDRNRFANPETENRVIRDDIIVAIGGVTGALRLRAEAEYKRLAQQDAKYETTISRLMLRMVNTEGGVRTRRRLPLSELQYADDEENSRCTVVITTFTTAARLLVTNTDPIIGEYVEPAHDVLVTSWSRLDDWVKEAAPDLTTRRLLTQTSAEWQALVANADRHPAERAAEDNLDLNPNRLLWTTNPRLPLLERLYSPPEGVLGQMVQTVRDTVRLPRPLGGWLNKYEAAFARQSQLRRRLTLRIYATVGVALLGLAILFGLAAAQAIEQRDIAQQQGRVSSAARIAAHSSAQLERDPELSLLLALEAVATTRSRGETVVPSAENSLHDALLSSALRYTLYGHSAPVLMASWSHDGAAVVTASADGTARICDAACGESRLVLGDGPGMIFDAQWSPDDQLVLTSSDDGAARVWDASSGELRATLGGPSGRVRATWSLDGRLIASGGGDGTVQIWDSANGKRLLTLAAGASEIRSLDWQPGSTRLLTVALDGAIRIWDSDTGHAEVSLVSGSQITWQASWSPDGGRFFTIGDAGQVRVWTADGAPVSGPLGGPRLLSYFAAWSPEGERIAVAGGDGDVWVWPAAGGTPQVLRGHEGLVNWVAWNPSGDLLASAGGDGTARIWDVASAQTVTLLLGHKGPLNTIAWHYPDGARLLTSSNDNQAKIWSADGGAEMPLLHAAGIVQSVAWSADSQFLVTAERDGTAEIWHSPSSTLSTTLQLIEGAANAVAWHPGSLLATAGQDGVARVWNVRDTSGTAQDSMDLANDSTPLTAIIWSPDAKLLLIGDSAGIAKVWDPFADKVLFTLRGHSGAVNAVAWSPDRRLLATGGADHTARIWDAATGEPLAILSGHQDSVLSLGWSPDSLKLLTGSQDVTARLWAIDPQGVTGYELFVLHGHSGAINSVAWNPNGTLLATGSSDRTTRVWGAADGLPRFVLSGHGAAITGVAWNADGDTLASVSKDKTLRRYVIALPDLLALAQQRVTRELTIDERAAYINDSQPAAQPLSSGANATAIVPNQP